MVGVVVASRLYLGVDHPVDIVAGVVIGAAIPLVAFRFFVPNELFPVTYQRRKTAHLAIDDRRAEAIRRAVRDQLGMIVIDITPIGLAGSGGSTPLRLGLADGRSVFGKLYAMNHVRADRWYKMGRTVLYGRLEDEAPFRSVRRLVQQEDYTLRVMRDAGVPTAAPLGVVELTPEREYLLVTEFVDGAVEIGEAEVDEGVIDNGLLIIRRLWDTGLAHRDIKPANLLVREGRVVLIDVAFAQVRPSPWREAVDLANMMLVLAVRSEPAVVYKRALAYFTPDDIAEAFAAARGIASPSQLRAAMRDDGRDLIRQFRALAPHREPISLQRWGPRRLGLVAAIAVIGGVDAVHRHPAVRPRRPARCRAAQLRDRRRDGPHGPGGADGDVGAVPRVDAGRLGSRWRACRGGPWLVLAGRRRRRSAGCRGRVPPELHRRPRGGRSVRHRRRRAGTCANRRRPTG